MEISWNCIFEFLWELCFKYCIIRARELVLGSMDSIVLHDDG